MRLFFIPVSIITDTGRMGKVNFLIFLSACRLFPDMTLMNKNADSAKM
jgi:hypothetical protein